MSESEHLSKREVEVRQQFLAPLQGRRYPHRYYRRGVGPVTWPELIGAGLIIGVVVFWIYAWF